ncbi:Hypothetical predicted protein [Mytilus galloprovincialis]|uniref:Methyltransferase FkbM domain-containing protein n=1 Tax=Mytilus galloprovincialis TaxID=29158 RepID=A0A8B6BZG6_MYTGA|nr:Hypothetical predicted protein [Mytilus galloprovincialis]
MRRDEQLQLLLKTIALLVLLWLVKAFINKTTPENLGLFANNIYTEEDAFGKVITRDSRGWVIDTRLSDGKITDDFVLVHLNNPPNTPIYVYPKDIDMYVSSDIIMKGEYEPYNVKIMIQYMKRFPNAVFLDLGAFVGSFSIAIAALEYKVVAVECLKSSVRRLYASMKEAGVSDRMSIIHNVISDKRKPVVIETEPGNMGLTYVDLRKSEGKEIVESIVLDDLLEIFQFKEAIIKMDVHQFEDMVLNGAYKFFKKVNVEAVLMEFIHHQSDTYDNDGKFIVDFMEAHGLEPDVPEDIKQYYKKWTKAEILFKRNKPFSHTL